MLTLIQAAGWPIWPLIALSIVALSLIIERFFSLARGKILPANLQEQVLDLVRLRQITPDVVDKLAVNSPLGSVLAAGLRTQHAPTETLQASLEHAGRREAHKLERYLPALGTIASIAPLMGLFGTVVGMIEIFGAGNGAGTNPQQLAHGISVALYNTAFGLVVAIPALLFYRYFKARVENYVVEIEGAAQELMDTIAAMRMGNQR